MAKSRGLKIFGRAMIFMVIAIMAPVGAGIYAAQGSSEITAGADLEYVTITAGPEAVLYFTTTGHHWSPWIIEKDPSITLKSVDGPITFELGGSDGRVYKFEFRVKWGWVDDGGERHVPKGSIPELDIVFVGMEKAE